MRSHVCKAAKILNNIYTSYYENNTKLYFMKCLTKGYVQVVCF